MPEEFNINVSAEAGDVDAMRLLLEGVKRGPQFDTITAMLASERPALAVGEIWEAGGHRYETVEDGEWETTQGGAKLKVLPVWAGASGGIYIATAFGEASGETVQKAIDASFSDGGGTVMAPAGEYLVSVPIILKDGVTLDGAGHATVFKNAAGSNCETISIRATYPVNKIFDAGIRNFKIDGNVAYNTYSNVTDAGIRLQADVHNPFSNGSSDDHGEIKNVAISGIYVTNHRAAMYAGKTTFVERAYTVDRLHADKCTTAGVYLADYCEYVNFSNCIFEDCYDGIYDNGSSNIAFSNCFFTNNSNAGANLYSTGRNTSKKSFTGCTFNHNAHGLLVQANYGTISKRHSLCRITGCSFLANTKYGIGMIAGTQFAITGNTFAGNSEGNPGTYADLYMAAIVEDTVVNGNVFQKGADTRCAIHLVVAGAAAGVKKQYNNIHGNTYDGYDPIYNIDYPSALPLDANTNIIDGHMEFWNTSGKPPSSSADNAKANIDYAKIPYGTILTNRAADDEYWTHVKFNSLGASSGAMVPLVTTGQVLH